MLAMRINLTHLAATLAGFALLLCVPALAQDDLPVGGYQDPGYQETNTIDDKTLLYESTEGKSLRTIQSIPRDTVRSAPTKPKADAKKPGTTGGKPEDALSFNFLYYIIQKFKISDIVDQ